MFLVYNQYSNTLYQTIQNRRTLPFTISDNGTFIRPKDSFAITALERFEEQINCRVLFPYPKDQADTLLKNKQASTNYREAFSLFDKRGNGRVSLESLGDLLRACGQNPTLAEIRDLEKSVGGDCTYLLTTLPPF